MLNPIAFIVYFFLAVTLIMFLQWVYSTLNSETILEAISQSNVDCKWIRRKPKKGFIIGACIPIVLLVVMSLSLLSETAEKAKTEAEKITGPGYKYSISSWNINSTFGGKTFYRANVTAYNEHEIKAVRVEWEK